MPIGEDATVPAAQHFLSVYMAPPDPTALAAMRHDHCAALWRTAAGQVELVRYWEFERATGLKHHRIPLCSQQNARAFLSTLLAEVGLTLDDMAAVWGTPGLESDSSYLRIAEDHELPAHSLAHVFSSLLLDWRLFRSENIFAMALDTGPDWTLDRVRSTFAYAGCVSVRGDLEFFPVESPGILWYLARRRFGPEEGTLMALGSATECRVPLDVVGRVRGLEFWSPDQVLPAAELLLDGLVGEVERRLADRSRRERYGYDRQFSHAENVQSAVMKLVADASAVVVDRNIDRCRDRFSLDFTRTYLALSGGYALNCPSNTRLLDRYRFRGLLAPPCVNDGGQALGLGLMGLHARRATESMRFALGTAYHGNRRLGLDQALARFAPFVREIDDLNFEQAVEDLSAGPVAWVDGPAEIGPRALGHRSLLGDPTSHRTKETLNAVKRRQWWRPVAPMVLRPFLSEWFHCDRPSPFMLEALRCRSELAGRIPAAVHRDGTARVQTLTVHEQPILYQLVETYRRRTGVPLLCNTSLNDRGEPIVDNAAQALNFCIRKGITVAYIGGKRIRLRNVAAPEVGGARIAVPPGPEPRDDGPFSRVAMDWPALWRSVTDRGIPAEAVFLAAWNPPLRARLLAASAGGDRGHPARELALLRRAVTCLDRPEQRYLGYGMNRWGPAADPWQA